MVLPKLEEFSELNEGSIKKIYHEEDSMGKLEDMPRVKLGKTKTLEGNEKKSLRK